CIPKLPQSSELQESSEALCMERWKSCFEFRFGGTQGGGTRRKGPPLRAFIQGSGSSSSRRSSRYIRVLDGRC
ncbi:unnamed protein product, partial [Symbiodinium sp. CCMP2456]